mmetsp:Transcript_18959/g.54632  ORF Transcript_18959/g.54632 Transcript_18959/m.54632 type:complete len:827 (-) Transcript_18959:89-2569(-)
MGERRARNGHRRSSGASSGRGRDRRQRQTTTNHAGAGSNSSNSSNQTPSLDDFFSSRSSDASFASAGVNIYSKDRQQKRRREQQSQRRILRDRDDDAEEADVGTIADATILGRRFAHRSALDDGGAVSSASKSSSRRTLPRVFVILLGCVALSILTNRRTTKKAAKQTNKNNKAGYDTYKDPFFGYRYSPPAENGVVGVGDNKKMKIPAGFGLKYGQRRNKAGRIVTVNYGSNERTIIGRRDGLEGDDDFVANMDPAVNRNAALRQPNDALDNLLGNRINVMNAEISPPQNINNLRGLDQAGGDGAEAGAGVSLFAKLKDQFHEKHDEGKSVDLLANDLGALSASGIGGGGGGGGGSSWEKRQKQGPDQSNTDPVPVQQQGKESEAPPLKQILDQMPLPEEPASYYEPSAAVAYVVPIVSCPDDLLASLPLYDPARYQNATRSDKAFRDAAAILQYSIAKVHARGGSRYDYQMYVIIHPSAVRCVDSTNGDITDRHAILTALGYRVLIRSEPVSLRDFGSSNPDQQRVENYKRDVEHAVGGGYRDFVRLHSFAMIWHNLVVMVDLHTMFLQPIEDLYDALLGASNGNTIELPRLDALRIRPKTQLLFTRDYNTVTPHSFNSGYETGLLVLEPNQSVFDDLVNLLLVGQYDTVSGWGTVGSFVGYPKAKLSSGLLPYYFEHVRGSEKNAAVEISACVYANKNDEPHVRLPDKSEVCRDGTSNCVDCRARPFEDIRVAIMTVCRSPWTCFFHQQQREEIKHCRWFHSTWFQFRKELEEQKQDEFPPVDNSGGYFVKHYHGYCSRQGFVGYTPMGKVEIASDPNAILGG